MGAERGGLFVGGVQRVGVNRGGWRKESTYMFLRDCHRNAKKKKYLSLFSPCDLRMDTGDWA